MGRAEIARFEGIDESIICGNGRNAAAGSYAMPWHISRNEHPGLAQRRRFMHPEEASKK
jgi:hypothetical protein